MSKDPKVKAVKQAYKNKLLQSRQALLIVMDLEHGTGNTNTELSEMTGITTNLVSMRVAKMVDDGILMKRFHHRDTRKVNFYLTQKGKDIAAEYWAAINELYKATHRDEEEGNR